MRHFNCSLKEMIIPGAEVLGVTKVGLLKSCPYTTYQDPTVGAAEMLNLFVK